MEETATLASAWTSLLQKREQIGAKAKELISSSEEGKCSYEKGYITQEVYLCKTCNKSSSGSGICVGCYLDCHIDHEVAELGPKRNFRCDCGTPRISGKCNFAGKKEENKDNLYNHNFLGKFCVCSQEDNEDRECEMFMCVGCFDWFHSDCIKLSNDCHNHSESRAEVIPSIPENANDYFFMCFKCLRDFKFIPAAYVESIYFDQAVKRMRSEGCPLQGKELDKEYPYHVFIEKSWIDSRCKCEDCEKLKIDEVFLAAEEIENKKGLLEIINEESEKIMENEDFEELHEECDLDEINKLPHQMKIEIANGMQGIKEAFDEITEMMNGSVGEELIVETFEKKLREKFEAYKKAKFTDDAY